MLAEWHLDPLYIVDNWTDEMLELMVNALAKRHKMLSDAYSGKHPEPEIRRVADSALFRQMGNKIKVIKE